MQSTSEPDRFILNPIPGALFAKHNRPVLARAVQLKNVLYLSCGRLSEAASEPLLTRDVGCVSFAKSGKAAAKRGVTMRRTLAGQVGQEQGAWLCLFRFSQKHIDGPVQQLCQSSHREGAVQHRGCACRCAPDGRINLLSRPKWNWAFSAPFAIACPLVSG